MSPCIYVKAQAEIICALIRLISGWESSGKKEKWAKKACQFLSGHHFYYHVLNYYWDSDLTLDLMGSVQTEFTIPS